MSSILARGSVRSSGQRGAGAARAAPHSVCGSSTSDNLLFNFHVEDASHKKIVLIFKFVNENFSPINFDEDASELSLKL